MARVIVVGAGVVGLSCAVRLLEAGHRVDLVARDLPLETTSMTAAALWYPHRALPADRVLAWSRTAYDVFGGLAADEATGVRMLTGTQVLREPGQEPWWREAVPSVDRETSLPPGYADGWTLSVPVIDMTRYLPWLQARVELLGGTVTRLNLAWLPQVEPGGVEVVVNCSGLGARLLGNDPSVVPVGGQVVHVAQFGLDRWLLDADGPTYVVPRGDHVVVGGTDAEGDWNRTPDPATATAILARAERLVPELAGARVLRHRVGLRPVRPAVRLERTGDVVHCYGHGGAGVTLSWGCAAEVAGLVSQA